MHAPATETQAKMNSHIAVTGEPDLQAYTNSDRINVLYRDSPMNLTCFLRPFHLLKEVFCRADLRRRRVEADEPEPAHKDKELWKSLPSCAGTTWFHRTKLAIFSAGLKKAQALVFLSSGLSHDKPRHLEDGSVTVHLFMGHALIVNAS
jgi:hypothetical protein